MNISGLLGRAGSGGIDLGAMVEKLRPVNRVQAVGEALDKRPNDLQSGAVAAARARTQANDVSISRNADGSITIVEKMTDSGGRDVVRNRTVSRSGEGAVFVREQMSGANGPAEAQSYEIRQQNLSAILAPRSQTPGIDWSGDAYSRSASLSRSAPLISLTA